MTRLTMVLAIWIAFVSQAAASLTPRKESARLGSVGGTRENVGRAVRGAPGQGGDPKNAESLTKPGAARSMQSASPVMSGAASEYVLTTGTEVLLDGRPCKYEKVPAGASIILMEVAQDHKTVLRVYFRSPR